MSEKKEKSKLSLSAKAKKFDVPLGTLKKVYKRGVAAWNSGHRPGTTPQQWGHARVNSFLRKGKTYHTADKDLRENLVIERLQLVPPTPEEEDDYMNRVRNNWDKGMNDDDAYREATRETGVGYYRDQMWKMVDGMRPLNKIPTKVGDHPASSFVNKNLLNRVSKLKDINVNVIDDFDQRYPDAAGEQVITYADPKTNKLRSRPFDINISLDPKVMTKSSGMRSVIPNQNIVAHGFQHVADALGGQDAGNSNDSWFDLDRERIAHLTGRWFDMSPEERKNKVWTDTAAEIDAEMDRAAAAQKSIEARRSRNNSTSSEAPEPLNELKKETMQSYLEKRPSVKIKDVIAARAAEKAGDENPIYRLAKIQKGRRRAQNKINKIDAQAAAAERQRKIASGEITAADLEREHLNLHHPYAPRVPGVPDKPGSRYWGDHVEHEDVNKLFEKAMDDETNPFEYTGIPIPKKKDAMDPEDMPGLQKVFVPASPEKKASAEALKQQGKTAREIHAQTGVWYNNFNQEPWEEISDDEIKLKDGVGDAQNLIQHDRLTKRYPEIFNSKSYGPMQADITTLSPERLEIENQKTFRNYGSYSPPIIRNGKIEPAKIKLTGSPEENKKTAGHELSHYIMHRFYPFDRELRGSNPERTKNQNPEMSDEDAYKAYRANKGETAARLVGNRINLTPYQRSRRYPSDDLTPDEKLNHPDWENPIKPSTPAPAPTKPPTNKSESPYEKFMRGLDNRQYQSLERVSPPMREETNPFEYTGIPIPKKKDAMDPENKPGLRGIFLDATAEQQKRAAELEKKGKKGEDIWKEVGAYKDPYTGKWTREISDKEMDLPGFQPQSGLIQSDKKPKTQPAQTAIKHDKLFQEVPGVKATQVTTQSVTPVEKIFGKLPYRGLYSGADVRRGYTPPSIHTLTIGKKGALDVMAHELQHNVDDLQNRFSPPKYDTATFNQSRLTNMMRHSVDPNEIRANAAMSRRELDDKQRQERYPLKDYKLGASIFGGKVGIPLTWVPQSLREMQLVGTDEYRQHAIAMTPGQDQEIEDAFPPEVYGTEVYEPTTQEESANAESDGSVESGVDSTSGNSFRAIRKKLQEQEVEELEDEEQQIEGEEEEEEQTEDDGAEDGVDFTPNLKTTKARKYVPQVSAADSVSGFPVLGIAEGLFDKIKAVKKPTSPPRPPVSKTSNILRNVGRNAGRISTGAAVVGAGAKAAAGDYSGAATDAAVQAGQSAAAKLATKKAATMTAKFVSKAAARKLPLGLGLAATGAGVADRLRSRDYLGAAGEGLSGLAGTLPGVGTAVSAGIDTALLGRDLKNLQAQTQQKKKPTLAEAVEYHQENNISLIENAFRPGSEMFFAMILEAKRQYAEGEYTPQDEFEQDLLESDIGEVAEYNGETVLLDFPYEDEELNEEGDPTHGKGIGKPFRSRGGGAVYVKNEKGNVIKVNFSQSGMRKRFNEPARVRSFVARHNCYGNKDRTSASYWACRWPRYFSDSGQQWW